MKKTEFNLMGSVCMCVCVLADPSVPQEKFTRTYPTFTHTYTHSLSLTHAYQKASQGIFPSSVKAMILYLGYFVTEKPTINKPQLFRQVFKIVIFY